jgi:hypothetical protein
MPIQSLQGNGAPYERLVNLLSAGDFQSAAIDAPFSLPLAHMPAGGHTELLRQVAALPDGSDRPFPTGESIVELGVAIAPKTRPKPLRLTEEYWTSRGVNTRSTMWNGPRGGAPFAAACLRLLERSGRPCWPWATVQPGILCEAFPAAQLKHWGLCHQGYSGADATANRSSILAGLRNRLMISPIQAQIAAGNPDALDAVIATFGAIAVADGTVIAPNEPFTDGFIAVAQ